MDWIHLAPGYEQVSVYCEKCKYLRKLSLTDLPSSPCYFTAAEFLLLKKPTKL